MAAKYREGAKVRVRAPDQVQSRWRSQVQLFDGKTGAVVSSVEAVGFVTHAWAEASSPPVRTFQFYNVLLDIGVELDFVTEDSLEEADDQ